MLGVSCLDNAYHTSKPAWWEPKANANPFGEDGFYGNQNHVHQ